ncbi:tetratricopeptide repeat protein [Caminibacter mediatlanticus]|uniref:Tetratricopeptide repeat protein n=1 Tax=Caminibacter mediatlanticus TB-2 TaxID=391592 RepID=A0AAI9F190_9BACT|nr:hypothetical protein [Caminibacter mediatlanticus]EDM23462.1 hypothetical protein CMTB2_08002 [Caminibacter mediatlanticus TB-2]
MKYFILLCLSMSFLFSKIPIKTGYCIQALSSKNKELLIKKFKDNFPYARIEKIGSFYVIRFFQEENIKDLKSVLPDIKKEYKSAFIRKCDYIPQRIIYPNQKNIKKVENKKSNLKIIQKNKTLLPKNIEYTPIQRQEIIFKKGLTFLKDKKYKRACTIFNTLFQLYQNTKYYQLRNKACYNYYYSEIIKNLSDNPLLALDFIEKVKKIRDDNNLTKYKAIAYFNINNYKEVFNLLKNYPNKDNKLKNIYLISLFKLGFYNQIIDNIEIYKNCPFYKKNKIIFDSLIELKNNNFEKAYYLAKKYYNQNPIDKTINIILANIMLKINRIDYALMYLQNINVYSIDELKLLRDIYYTNYDYTNAYHTVKRLNEMNYNDILNDEIKKEYLLLQADRLTKNKNFNKALKYAKEADKIKSDEETLSKLGEIYEKMKNYSLAYKEFYNAMLLKPQNQYFQKEILKILFKTNDLDKAKNFAMKSNLSEIRNYYYILLAKYYLNKNDFVNANIALSNIEKENSKEFYEVKGIVCFYLKEYKCSINYLDKAFDSKEKIYYLIRAYSSINLKNKAKELLSQFSNKFNIDKTKLAGLYIEIGDIKKAKELLK